MNNPQPSSSSPRDRHLLHGVDWAVQASAADEIMLGVRRRVRRRRQQRLAFAGAVAVVALGFTAWFSFLTEPASRTAPAGATVVTVPTRQALPDGSVVELKDGAEISVAYSPGTRRVALIRGEAHFSVVKDPARPFIVAVDAVEVRAVGTSFSVQRLPAQVAVVVTTGRVAVDRVEENVSGGPIVAPQTVASLDEGHRTLVDAASTAAAPSIETVSSAQMTQLLAWRIPRLEFTRTPLADAVKIINQHCSIQVSLADSSLGSVRISGYLRADNVESLFQLLDTEHDIKAERRSATEVVLRPGH